MTEHATVQVGAEAWTATGTGDRAGTAVVLVHGLTGNPKGTRPLGEVLHDAGFSVDVVRLPGHGTTIKDMAATRWSDWRTTVTHAVDRALREHDRVILVGHSMGATLTLDLAGHRDDITAAVAINAIVVAPPDPLARLAPVLQHLIPTIPRDLAGMPTNDIARPGMSEDAYPRVPSKSTQSLLMALPGIRAGLATLTCPLLVVSSRVDHTVDPVNGDCIEAEAASTDLRRVFLDRSFHVPQLDWDRDVVEAAVRDFVIEMHDAARVGSPADSPVDAVDAVDAIDA